MSGRAFVSAGGLHECPIASIAETTGMQDGLGLRVILGSRYCLRVQGVRIVLARMFEGRWNVL